MRGDDEDSMVKRRRRFKQTTTLAQRLTEQASSLRDRATMLSPGQEQSLLWRKIHQAETALRIDEWLSAPGSTLPTNVMPAMIRRQSQSKGSTDKPSRKER
jgi:hypothetical protein